MVPTAKGPRSHSLQEDLKSSGALKSTMKLELGTLVRLLFIPPCRLTVGESACSRTKEVTVRPGKSWKKPCSEMQINGALMVSSLLVHLFAVCFEYLSIQ